MDDQSILLALFSSRRSLSMMPMVIPVSVFFCWCQHPDTWFVAQAHLWSADPTTNQVTATWTNPGNIPVAAEVCRSGNSLELSGNCLAAGLPQVVCPSFPSFFFVIFG
jgi:hypothetical protein